jgi:hypothetical protein
LNPHPLLGKPEFKKSRSNYGSASQVCEAFQELLIEGIKTRLVFGVEDIDHPKEIATIQEGNAKEGSGDKARFVVGLAEKPWIILHVLNENRLTVLSDPSRNSLTHFQFDSTLQDFVCSFAQNLILDGCELENVSSLIVQ